MAIDATPPTTASTTPANGFDDALLRGVSDLGEGLLVFQGGRILEANAAFRDIAGRDFESLVELDSVLDLVAPELRAELASRLRRYLLGQEVEDHFRTVLVRPDGDRVDLEVSVKSMSSRGRTAGADIESGRDGPWRDGDPAAGAERGARTERGHDPLPDAGPFLVLVRDVRQHVRLEEALREQKLLLEAQSEASLEGILVVDRDGRVVFSNRRFAELWRIPDDVLAQASEAVTQAAVGDLVADPVGVAERAQALTTDPEARGRDEVVLRDGRVFDRYTAPIRDESGGLHGRVWFFRDVTQERRRAETAAFLAEAGRMLAGTLEPETIGERLAELAVPRLAEWCSVDVVGGDGAFHRIGAAHVEAPRIEAIREINRRYPLTTEGGGLRAQVVATGVPVALYDIGPEARRALAHDEGHLALLEQVGLTSGVWVPLAVRRRVLGVLALGTFSDGRRVGPDDLSLAEEFAGRAALAIDNALAYRTLREREHQQATVAALGQLAISSGDLDRLFDEAVDRLARTLDVEFTKILELLPDGTALRLVAGVGWRPGLVGSARVGLDSGSQAGYALKNRAPVIVEDIRSDPRISGPPLLLEHGVVSGMSIVIEGPTGPWGVLGVHTARRRKFTPDDVHFLEAVGHVLAGAIRRRHDEAAVRMRDDRLELTLAASRTGSWEWDVRTGQLEWSDQISRLHGLPPGTSPRDMEAYLRLIHPDDRESFQSAVAETVDRGDHFDFEYRIVWPDGSVHWTNGVARVFRDEEGQPIRMVGIGRDITDRKGAEDERDRLLAQEREAHALREAFIGVLSHELRTPITTIYGGVKILAREGRRPARRPPSGASARVARVAAAPGAASPATVSASGAASASAAAVSAAVAASASAPGLAASDVPESAISAADERRASVLADVEAEADRLHRLVEDLLVLTRAERGRLEAADEPVQLGHLARRAVAAEQARWPTVTFATRIPNGLPVVRGDPTYIEQVLRNLLSNAAKYSPAGSKVRVVLSAGEAEVAIRVLDQGHGIAPDEVDKLFQLFYRSAATAKTAAGAGIGLFVARRLLETMGGRIWAAPRATGGSEFGFALPRYPEDEE